MPPDADLDIKSYCALLRSIKNYAGKLETNADNILIKEKFAEVPDIRESDFEFYTVWSGRGWLLLLFFPAGIIIWTLTYIKITRLMEKLHTANSKLSTADFFMQRMV